MNPNPQKSDAVSDPREQTIPRVPKFDTLRAVGKLKNAEFGEKQAVTLVETIQDAQSELATKADLEKVASDLRAEMGKMELRLRSDFDGRFASLYRFLLIGGGVMTAIISVVITLAITLAK